MSGCLKLNGYSFLVVASVSTQCPTEWHRHEDYCYRVFAQRATYDNTLSACAAHQGSLVTIPDSTVNGFLKSLTESFVDTFWIGLVETSNGLEWITGEPVTWSLWTGSDYLETPEHCFLMVRGQYWTTDYCQHIHQYICRVPRSDHTTSECPDTISVYATEVPTLNREVGAPTMQATRAPTTSSSTEEMKTSAVLGDRTEITTEKIFSTPVNDVPSAKHTTTEEDKVIIVKRKRNPSRTRTDNRLSAIGIGSAGLFIMVAILAGIILLDASKLFKDMKILVRNIRSAWK